MTIQETVERKVEGLARNIEIVAVECAEATRYREQPDFYRMRKGVHEYSEQFTKEILQAVVDGLPEPPCGTDDFSNGYGAAVTRIRRTLTSAISDLSGKEEK